MNLTKVHFMIVALSMLIFSAQLFGNEIIIINRPLSENDTRSEYPRELVQVALEKTKNPYGDFTLRYSKKMNWKRAGIELKHGTGIHIFQAATRAEWEKELIPVRIPVFKGLLGNRIFLINKQFRGMFATINSLSQLKQLKLGSGNTWAITNIFSQNGFNVVTTSNYEGMFEMLEHKRFDYLPRGINEAIPEFHQRKNKFPDLHIEKTILLYIPLPAYFFVTPTKPKLAERVEKGLNSMIKDGSFDRLFFKYHREMLDSVNLHKRKIFVIKNPDLSPETPLKNTELWLDMQAYARKKEK